LMVSFACAAGAASARAARKTKQILAFIIASPPLNRHSRESGNP
jgi:hypothetical protein